MFYKIIGKTFAIWVKDDASGVKQTRILTQLTGQADAFRGTKDGTTSVYSSSSVAFAMKHICTGFKSVFKDAENLPNAKWLGAIAVHATTWYHSSGNRSRGSDFVKEIIDLDNPTLVKVECITPDVKTCHGNLRLLQLFHRIYMISNTQLT